VRKFGVGLFVVVAIVAALLAINPKIECKSKISFRSNEGKSGLSSVQSSGFGINVRREISIGAVPSVILSVNGGQDNLYQFSDNVSKITVKSGEKILFNGVPKQNMSFSATDPEINILKWSGDVWISAYSDCSIRSILGIN